MYLRNIRLFKYIIILVKCLHIKNNVCVRLFIFSNILFRFILNFCVYIYSFSNSQFYTRPAHAVAQESQPTYLPAHVAMNSHLLACAVDRRLSHKAPKTGPARFSFPSNLFVFLLYFTIQNFQNC